MANGLFGTGIAPGQLRQTALQPAALPGSTYVRPQERRTGGNLTALAQALGGLNSSLQSFDARREQKEANPGSDLNREWIAKRQQMSIEQLREEARLGTPDGIRARQDALDALLGERANDEFRTRWTEFYNTEFDKVGGDMSAEYERMRQEYAAKLPSEISRGNFYRLTKDHFSTWQAEDTKQKVGFVKEQISTAVVASFRNANDDMVAKGMDATARAEAIFEASAANRTFLEMSGQEQNDTIFALAQEYALKGDKDLVRELLQGTRVGADGKPLPALASIPKYSTDALKLMDRATTEWEAKAKEDSLPAQLEADKLIAAGAFTEAEAEKRRHTGLWTDEQLSRMILQSTAVRDREIAKFQAEDAKREQRNQSDRQEHAAVVQTLGLLGRYRGVTQVKDVDVIARQGDGTRTISSKALIEQATELFEDNMKDREQKLVDGGATPEQAAHTVLQERLAFYAGNKLANPEWANVLNGIASRATMETLLERGEVSKELGQQADLYRELLAANPAYLSTILTDPKSREFLEFYDNALTNRRWTKEAALTGAAARVAMPESQRARGLLGSDKTQDIARDVLGELGVTADRATNYPLVVNRIIDMSLGGMTEREIRDRVKSEIENTSVTIHGMLVPDHRDLPRDFPVLIEDELQAAFEAKGKENGIPDVDDLYVVPVSGQSKWQIVSKSLGGMPIGYVTPQSLDARRAERERKHDELVRQMVRAKDAERAEYQRLYEAETQGMRDQIAKFRGRSGALSQSIADYLQGVLDDRLERDYVISHTTADERYWDALANHPARQRPGAAKVPDELLPHLPPKE